MALDYVADARAGCPPAPAIAAAVDRELGQAVIDGGAQQSVRLSIERGDAELTASISFRDAAGAEHAQRTLTAPFERCSDLVRGFALLVALHLSGNQAPPRPVPHATPTAPPVPRAPPDPPKPAPDPPVAPRPAVTAIAASPPPLLPAARSSFVLLFGPQVRGGLAPSALVGARLGAAWSPRGRFGLVLAADATTGGRNEVTGTGAYDVASAGLSLGVCWMPWARAPMGLSLCPGVSSSVVRVAGRDLDVSRSDATFAVIPGVDARAFVFLVRPWALTLVVGAAFNPRPHSVWLDGAPVWNAPGLWPHAALLLAYAWGRDAQ